MLHITCLNSAVSLRCRCGDPTYFLDARFETNPSLISSSLPSFDSCCCCCCANSSSSIYNRLPKINPNLLYNGLRQSTLIQWSPCKRLIFQGRRRQSNNLTSGFPSILDFDRNYYYEKLYSFKERRGWGKGRFECKGFEDKRTKQFLSNENDDCVDDVEIMLSLLTEEVGLDYIGVRERRRIKKKDLGTKKNVSDDVVKRDLKCDNKAVKVRSREEEDRRRRNERQEEERETFTRDANRGVRTEGSSCSSYYSISSTGEFESDNDVEVKHDGYRRSFDEKIEENVEDEGEILKKKNTGEKYYGELVGFNQDWRKKSEKKLNQESSQHQSNVSASYDGKSQQHSQKIDRITDRYESRTKYKQFTDMSERDNSVKESTSSSQKRYSDTEKKKASVDEFTGEHRGEIVDCITRQDEYRRQSNVISKVSENQQIDMRKTSSSALSETRMKNWEDNSTEVSSRVEDSRVEKHQKTSDLTKLNGSRVKSQQISNTHFTNTQSTVVSHKESEIRTEKQEQYSESSSSEAKVTKGEQVGQRRTSIEDKVSTSGVESVVGTVERYNRTDEGVSQMELRKSGRRTTKASSFHVGMPKEASTTYKALKLIPEPAVLESGARGGGKSGSRPIALAPSHEQHVELTHEHSSKHFETATGATQEHSGVQKPDILGGDKSGNSPGEPLRFISHEDTLSSADRQQKSAIHIVGEFVGRARSELSASEVQQEKKPQESKLVYEAEQDKIKSSGQDGSGSSHQKDEGSRRSSRGSGPKGPSDEMWHVTDASIQKPPETDAPDNTSSSSGTGEAVKRTGRSWWNVVGDVVRFRWASPRSETHTPKSGGGKGFSNQSTSSEAWFSGNEPDESNDENVKTGSTKGQSGSQKEESNPSSSKEKVEHEGLESPLSSSNTIKESSSTSMSSPVFEESSFPLAAIRMRRSPVVKKSSEAGETGASGSGKKVKTEQPVPKPLTGLSHPEASGSGKMVKAEQPVPNPLSKLSHPDASGSGKMVKPEQAVLNPLTEISPAGASSSGKMVIVDPSTDSKDGGLKQRKLAHTNQVSKDRFDEWEEAYNLETKRRKNDELFMREALLEAKKAADIWEVPVGAVLVHDGKIIARGYNLVEELRDATAHAEMICIREASNNLQSWRLSDTTLYVTLEPCPMCAGAILQARIDTVVWGAPNKLLGADGSWTRLFPDGDGGNGLEMTDKPPAPVHPFHPNMTIRRGVLSSECSDAMQQFFQLRRKKKTEPEPPPPPSSLPISHHHSKLFSKLHDAFSIMFCL